jgi:hypothetical protein
MSLVNDIEIYSDGATGDMYYRSSTGLWVAVTGTASTGYVPTKQSDGTIAWAAQVGSGAHTLIGEHVVPSGGESSVTFSSISGAYRHLGFRLHGRGTNATTFVRPRIRFNADTGNNYEWQRHTGHTTTVEAEGGGTIGGTGVAFIDLGIIAAASATSGRAGAIDCLILNYRGTTFWKNCVAHCSGNVTERYVMNGEGVWKSTSAITSLTCILDAGSYAQDTVISLYGIL